MDGFTVSVSAKHIAIVGASAAGVSAALAARRSGFDGRIVVIDRDPTLPYERPPLSKSLITRGAEEVANESLVPIVPIEQYKELDIDLVLGSSVEHVDIDRRAVVLSDSESIAADHLLFATGVRPRLLDVPGSEFANVLTLRTAADAEAISASLRDGGQLVVVGGGFIGLELAAAARKHGIDVTVIEPQHIPLNHVLGSKVAGLLLQLHRDQGVQFRLGCSVTSLRGTGSRAQAVVLDTGEELEAQTVVVGVGVVPNDELAARYLSSQMRQC